MRNNILLNVNYDLHPSFEGGQFVAKTEGKNLAQIDELYRLSTSKSDLLLADRIHLLTNLTASLWNKLIAQAPDDLIRNFFYEIWEKSDKVLINQFKYLGNSFIPERGILNEKTNQLLEERVFLDRLDSDSLIKMQIIAAPVVEQFKRRADEGRLSRDDLSINNGPEVKGLVKILNDSFTASGVLDSVSALAGVRMRVSGLALELSDSRSTWWRHNRNETSEPKTMYAHLDEDIGSPKSIVYLSDVDKENGPTSYYPKILEDMALHVVADAIGRIVGTTGLGDSKLNSYIDDRPYHQTFGSKKFRKLFMALPPEMRFNSHLGWDVIADSPLEHEMVQREKFIIGEAGTFMVFDGGRLFHRGGLITSGQRVVCQVIFGPKSATSIKNRVITKLKNFR
jgi:hypothetical protein